MSLTTRDQMLLTARRMFAARGFDGVSIAQIARAHGVTKQALLHHFSTKEKLYGEVLSAISSEFSALSRETNSLKSYLMLLQGEIKRDPERAQLLMRELLDNRRRADTAQTWYLKPFLQYLIGLVKELPKHQHDSDMEALAFVYQLLGAINYFGISGPTLTGIFGADYYAELEAAHREQFERLLDVMIGSSS